MLGYYGRPDTSALVQLLEVEGQKLGALVLLAQGREKFSETHRRLFSLLKEPFAMALSNTLKHQEVLRLKDLLADDNRYLHRELLHLSGDEIVGDEFGLKKAMNMVRQVALLSSPVLLLGETGVGKDVIANAIHYSSLRKDGPFVKVNCGLFRKPFWTASSSAMKRGRSRVPFPRNAGDLSERTRGRSSWTRSANCLLRHRLGCCGCFNTRN